MRWMGLGFLVALSSSSSAMTLAFANKWNALVNPISESGLFLAPAPNNEYFQIGNAGSDLIVRRVDGLANVWAQTRYDCPIGGLDRVTRAASDASGSLYVLYRSTRLGIVSYRLVKFNASCTPLWDVDLNPGGSTNATGLAVNGTGAFTVVQGAAFRFLFRVASANGIITQLTNLGSRDIKDVALLSSEAVLVGSNGVQPLLTRVNASTGAIIEDRNGSVGFSDDPYNTYDQVLTTGNTIFAGGRGIVGVNTSGFTMVYTPGGTFQSISSDAVSGGGIAITANTGYRVALEDGVARLVVRPLSIPGVQGIYSLGPYQLVGTPAVSRDGTRIAFEASSAGQTVLASALTNGTVEATTVPIELGEDVGQVLSGPGPNNFAAVSTILRQATPDEPQFRVFNTQSWRQPMGTFNFPEQQVVASVEDVAGARYLLLNGNRGANFAENQPILLKVNNAGVPQWSRTLEMGSSSDQRGIDLALSPDSAVVVTGYESSGRLHLMKVNFSGTKLWSTSYMHGGGSTATVPRGVSVGADGSIFVHGLANLISFRWDVLILKYDSNGSLQWTRLMDGGDTSDEVGGGYVMPNGNYVVTANLGSNTFTRAYSSSGGLLWTRPWPDTGGAFAQATQMVPGANGSLVVGVSFFRAAPARSVLGIRRLDPATNTVLMQSTLGVQPSTNFGLFGTPSGAVATWFQAPTGTRFAQLHPVTGAAQFNLPLSGFKRISDIAADRKNNLYLAVDEQPSTTVPENAAILRYTASGALTHKRTFAGTSKEVAIGLNDSVWATGSRWVRNRGQEASFTKWTQNLGP